MEVYILILLIFLVAWFAWLNNKETVKKPKGEEVPDAYAMWHVEGEKCYKHKRKAACDQVTLDSGEAVYTCGPCRDEILKRERYYCKYCGIAVKGKNDTTPWLRKFHNFDCPRYQK